MPAVSEKENQPTLSLPTGKRGEKKEKNMDKHLEAYFNEQSRHQNPKALIVPTVVEDTPNGRVSWDIYSRLLDDRIIRLTGPIDDNVADLITSQLLYLESDDPEADIFLYINSPGGVVTAGMSIYDTMQYIKPDVSTICLGMAASMGSLLLCAGAAGKRYVLPNSTVMVHQPSGGAQGQQTDIVIQAEEITRLKSVLNGIYNKHAGQSLDVVEAALNRDNYMDAQQAVDWGLADKVMTSHEIPAPKKGKGPKPS